MVSTEGTMAYIRVTVKFVDSTEETHLTATVDLFYANWMHTGFVIPANSEIGDTVVTGYEARCEKSNPKMFKRTLEILNVRPSEAVMIGDDVPFDIMIPKKLGIHTILLDRENKMGGSEFSEAVVDDLVMAIKIIEAGIRR